MKASPTHLSKFMQHQDTQFIIPIYQRNYDWTEVNCKQLLDDKLVWANLSKMNLVCILLEALSMSATTNIQRKKLKNMLLLTVNKD